MSALAGRVKRLYDAEYPPVVQLANRVYIRHVCLVWLGCLAASVLPEPTEGVIEATNILEQCWTEQGYTHERQQADWQLSITVAEVSNFLANCGLAEGVQAAAALEQWAKEQRRAGLDADVELTRLRDEARAFYAEWDEQQGYAA